MKNLLFPSLLLFLALFITDCNSQESGSNMNTTEIFSVISARLTLNEANITIDERNNSLHNFIKESTKEGLQSKQRKDNDNLKLKKEKIIEILDQLKKHCETLALDKNGKPTVSFNFELSMNQELVNKLISGIEKFKSFTEAVVGDKMLNMALYDRLNYMLVTDTRNMGITDNDWSHLNFDKINLDVILLNIERIKNEVLVVENILLKHIYSFCPSVGY